MVVDTQVFAYACLGVPEFAAESLKVLEREEEIWVPASFHAEILSVLWQWVRSRGLDRGAAAEILEDLPTFLSGVVPVPELWGDALELACEAGHSPYDTLFVALALRRGEPLVTYDAQLLSRFPGVARRPSG